MKSRVLYGVMGIALVALFIGGGTYAYFSDTETSTGNTFSAGTLNLSVGSDSTLPFAFDNLKPGDTGVLADPWRINNTGTIAGNLTITCGEIINNENGLTEPEESVDFTGGVLEGELGANLTVAFWIDSNANNTLDTGDYYLRVDGDRIEFNNEENALPDDAFAPLNEYSEKSWANLATIAGGASAGTFHVEYDLPGPTTGNDVQSDTCTFDLIFKLEQART
ncbi:TasA family protein [Methanofollis ethanolicus]|uniref:TasA family protein n=1 Tax=Methanofollis ethanolicus TaxID=488124 RepID=UPI0009F9DC58|nr:TasA family protein [Methanofollis ethanolicus]